MLYTVNKCLNCTFPNDLFDLGSVILHKSIWNCIRDTAAFRGNFLFFSFMEFFVNKMYTLHKFSLISPLRFVTIHGQMPFNIVYMYAYVHLQAKDIVQVALCPSMHLCWNTSLCQFSYS